MVPGSLEVPLPAGPYLWDLVIRPSGVEPPKEEEPEVKDEVIDKLVDAIIAYIQKSGILDKIIAALIEKLLEGALEA
jgi:hypothetical protein